MSKNSLNEISVHLLRPLALFLATLLLVSCTSPTTTLTPAPVTKAPPSPSTPHYTGWAYVAYPGVSQSDMEADLRRMKGTGANVVWVGHNNPGEVIADKVEPGLSYAVYAAAQDPASLEHGTALEVLEAQHRVLRAARAVGLPAVFPIGYQIQMGRAWNETYPHDLRRYFTGEPLDIYGGGVSASPYSPQYRADIRAYYKWVLNEFVSPYRDVILMLNLADEPLGGDYSSLAEAEFRARYGAGFAKASAVEVGEFQDRVIVDHAIWSAEQWDRLAPGLSVTMSFCGAQGRWSYRLPNVEALFRDTPSNFIPTFDAYLHDDLPFHPLTENEVGALTLFARSLGYYSARYSRELWLWPAGNRWGLAGDSSHPGDVGDALANGYLLTLAVRSTGGHLRGLALWNYNVRHQGLFGDPDPAPYDREAMFARVSAAFADWRDQMARPGGQVESLALLSEGWVDTYVGQTHEAVRGSPVDFARLLSLARADVGLAIVGDLAEREAVTTVLVLDPTSEYLTPDDLAQLRNVLERGGRLLVTRAVAQSLLKDSGQVEILPDDPLTLDEAGWAALLPEGTLPTQGLLISAPEVALFYQPGQAVAQLPAAWPWRAFDRGGRALKPTSNIYPHEFALAP